ncbi:AAA family ATPase [archaeon]|nr:AAA family ATPase [archaeon]
MKLIVTGTPGTGKTSIAGMLAKKLGIKLINELAFAQKKRIGSIDRKTGERLIPLKKLEKALKKELKANESLIVEGHLLCGLKLPADLIVVLRCSPKKLEARLSGKRNYSDEKILDNAFCEETGYCMLNAKASYPKEKIIEAGNDRNLKNSFNSIVKELRKRNFL